MIDPVELNYDDEAYAEGEDYEELLASTVQPPLVKRTKVTAVPVIVDDSEGIPFWQFIVFGVVAAACWYPSRALGRIVLSFVSRFTDYLGDDVPGFDAKDLIGVVFVSIVGYCIYRFALSGGRIMTTEAAQVEADVRAEALGYQTVNFIPISSLAVGILKFLSTAAALYLVFLIVVTSSSCSFSLLSSSNEHIRTSIRSSRHRWLDLSFLLRLNKRDFSCWMAYWRPGAGYRV